MSTSCVNFTELRFTSDAALRRYLADVESIWTPEIMTLLGQHGLQRRAVEREGGRQERWECHLRT